ncbi:MAG: 23S rRNA (pseudouridine(1915)-N(3))-methyltransferase RlmH [Clostridia bacterium]|nr:23S rRNA (pseudouridine(1915)-N(3))-methyltransferase RlmH [Clostridia bacterium]
MRKITLICVGTLKETYLINALQEYIKRISRFFDLEIIQVPETKLIKNSPSQIKQVISSEGKSILNKINSQTVFPLSIDGDQIDSIQFAKLIEKYTDLGEITFVIGGSYGLDSSIKRLGKNISFSKLTFPHQLMRVLFLEQLYRAATILNNIEYHK